jgi:hypothetical protein
MKMVNKCVENHEKVWKHGENGGDVMVKMMMVLMVRKKAMVQNLQIVKKKIKLEKLGV